MGLLGMEAFTRNRLHTASVTFPEFQREGSNSCSSGKGGVAETREEQSRNNTAALGQGPGSVSRGSQNSIFELFCRAKPPATLDGYSRVQTYNSRGFPGQ